MPWPSGQRVADRLGDEGLPAATASSRSSPRARWAAIAAESMHPVPCVFAVSMRSASTQTIAVPSKNRSSARSPARCPPFTRTALGPSDRMASRGVLHVAAVPTRKPVRPLASGRFGVTRVASGRMRSRRAPTASSASSGCPCLDMNTGSTTRLRNPGLGDRVGDGLHDGGRRKHPGLRGIDADVAHHGPDLVCHRRLARAPRSRRRPSCSAR